MMLMGLAKLLPSAEVLAENLKPEVGASIDAHLFFSCEAYLIATARSPTPS
jgi:hypothetical protein